MELSKLAEAAAALGMTLTLAGVGRDPEPGVEPLCDAGDLRPESLETLLAAAFSNEAEEGGRGAGERFERVSMEPAGEGGRGARAELIDRFSGASAWIHWIQEAGQSEIAAIEIRDSALFESLASAEALNRRREAAGAQAWERMREREELAVRLASLWAATESKRGESAEHRVLMWRPAVELSPGTGVYGPAVFDLASMDGASQWRVSRADNGILRVSALPGVETSNDEA